MGLLRLFFYLAAASIAHQLNATRTTKTTDTSLASTSTIAPELVALCNKTPGLATAEIIATCKESPRVYIDGGVLYITNETEADVNRFFETKQCDFDPNNCNFSLHIDHNRNIRHLNFGHLPSVMGLRIFNTSLVKVTMKENFAITGQLFVHGNTNLTNETLKALKDRSHSGDVQATESECVVDPINPMPAFQCHEVYGDLVFSNVSLSGMDLKHTTTFHGCLDFRDVDVPYNFFTLVRFKHCNSQSVLNNVCMTDRDKATIEITLHKNYSHVQPSNCHFVCYDEDLHRNQTNCTAFFQLFIDSTTPNVDLLRGVKTVFGRLTIFERNESIIDFLSNIEKIKPLDNINDAGIDVINNPNLRNIVWNKNLIIEKEGLGCSARVVSVVGNPKYNLTEEVRQRYHRLAQMDSCIQSSLDIDPYDSSGLLPEPVDDPPPAVGQLPAFEFNHLEWQNDPNELLTEPVDILTADNARWVFYFFMLLLLICLPLGGVVYLLIRLIRCCRRQKKLKREIEQRRQKTANWPFPTDLTKTEGLTIGQTQKLFVFVEELIAMPVLRLRELVSCGVEGGVTELYAMDRRKSLTKVLEDGNGKLNMKQRQKLAKEIDDTHAMPVYEMPMSTELEQLYALRRNANHTDKDPIRAYNLFRNNKIYEFNTRPGYPCYRNENKLREIFGIWSREDRQLYTLFGTGPDLTKYAMRDFKLKEVKIPKKQSDHFDEEMRKAGIETTYYECEYHSQKVNKDRKRRFLVEFHNIPLEGMHALSRNMEVIRAKPFIQLSFLAKLLDAPVICHDAEVFFLLKMFHTTFFYIYDYDPNESSSSETSPLLAAIDIALDELDLFCLTPADSIHIFALQFIDFCRDIILEKKEKGGFSVGSKILQSYHTRKSSRSNLTGEKEIEASTRKSLDLYVKSTLELVRVVQNHLLFAESIDLQAKLPSEETRGCHYQTTVYTIYWKTPLEEYAIEMQPSFEVMRKKSQDRAAAYRARVARLKVLMKNCNFQKKSFRHFVGSKPEGERRSAAVEDTPLLPIQTNEN